MKSKTSFFNKTLVSNLYKRFWPIFAAYLAIWVLLLPISLHNSLRSAISYAQNTGNNYDAAIEAARYVMQISHGAGIVMSAIFGVLIAMAAFGYLYNARSVSMMCSLPIKREGVFCSLFTAGLAGMLASNLIVFALTAFVESACGALSFGYLLQGLAMICLMNIFFFGFASLCASFTGHILVLPAVYAVLNFTAWVVEFFVNTVLRLVVYGYGHSADTDSNWLSPMVGMFNTSIENTGRSLPNGDYITTAYYFDGWTQLIIYGIVGLVFAVCALLLIKKRRMETAGDVVAVRPLKPIFKYCLSIGCALVIGTAIYYTSFYGDNRYTALTSALLMLLFMLIGAFIGYFSAEMLMQKTLRVFSARSWAGYCATAFVITALMLCVEFDVFGYERAIPAPDKIESIELRCDGLYVELEQEENLLEAMRIHEDIINNKSFHENERHYDGRYFYLTIDYKLKNGKVLERKYSVYDSDGTGIIGDVNELFNTKEAVEYRKQLDIPVNSDTMRYGYISYFDAQAGEYIEHKLTVEQMLELYNTCILPDMDSGALGRIWFISDDAYYDTVCACRIEFELNERAVNKAGVYYYKYDYFDTAVTADAERTLKWLEENTGIVPVTEREASDYLSSTMTYEEMEKYGYAVDYPAATETVR